MFFKRKGLPMCVCVPLIKVESGSKAGIDGTYKNCVGLRSTTRNGENTKRFITEKLKKVF